MRYIGNKTRLLPFILRTIRKSGLRAGTVHDAFAGTGSVSRALKARGWRVHTSDILMSSYVFQRAYVVAESVDPSIDQMVGELENVPAVCGFISEHFSPAGREGRMYFTPENAGMIDATRDQLDAWRRERRISDDSYYLILAAIIEGADRVANTAGVYASYMKQWQPNARRKFQVRVDKPVQGSHAACAYLLDAREAATVVGEVDLIYIDPPYNSRQYVAYYHIPEILARGWSEGPPAIRGKVGLLAGAEGRSEWSHGRKVERLLSDLLASSKAKHALISFNSEGHLSPERLRGLLEVAAMDGEIQHFTQSYRRYRADSEREGRHYQRDKALEHLYMVRLR